MRENGMRPKEIARQLGVSVERVASLLWRYENTSTGLEHGKLSTYQYYGCRCVECIMASTNRGAARREEIREHPEQVTHGTYTGYFSLGCRCPECKAFGDPLVRKVIEPIAEATRSREPWTEAEIELLRDYSKTAKELAAELGRTPVAVKAQRRQMWKDTFSRS
jgi:DNA-binding CsgD family transcriptional regulator